MTFDLLILKLVSESRVTWATSVPILVFLSLSVLELDPTYAAVVRQTDVRQKHHLMPPPSDEKKNQSKRNKSTIKNSNQKRTHNTT